MNAAAKKMPMAQPAAGDLEVLVTACRSSREKLLHLDSSKVQLPARLKNAQDRVVVATTALGTVEIEIDAQRAVGTVDETRLRAAEAELVAAKADVSAIERTMRGIGPGLDRLRAELDEQCDVLGAAIAAATAPLRAEAAVKYSEAVQLLRDALTIDDIVSSNSYSGSSRHAVRSIDFARLPDIGGVPEGSWAASVPSPDIVTAVAPFRTALAEHDRAMRRLLR